MLRKEDKVEEGGKNIRGCENRCEDEFARRRKFAREKEESLRGRKRFTLLVDMERVMTLMFFQDFFFPGFLVCFFFARRFLRGDFFVAKTCSLWAKKKVSIIWRFGNKKWVDPVIVLIQLNRDWQLLDTLGGENYGSTFCSSDNRLNATHSHS
jgi:hypothetical protein